jgi:hypothetical protein
MRGLYVRFGVGFGVGGFMVRGFAFAFGPLPFFPSIMI